MIDLNDINEFFEEIFGGKVIITSQNPVENEKDQLQFVVTMLQSMLDRDMKLAEITGVEFSSYNEPYFIIIDNLLLLHYGEDISDVISFYLYSNKDEDGNYIPYNDDEENPIYIKDFEDLWEIVSKHF